MTTPPSPYRGFRYPAEVIEYAVWLYHCFSLRLRDVELILAARGVVVSDETTREWGLRLALLQNSVGGRGSVFDGVVRRERRCRAYQGR
jgi:transposase-like protein